jgi:hypothetical protein
VAYYKDSFILYIYIYIYIYTCIVPQSTDYIKLRKAARIGAVLEITYHSNSSCKQFHYLDNDKDCTGGGGIYFCTRCLLLTRSVWHLADPRAVDCSLSVHARARWWRVVMNLSSKLLALGACFNFMAMDPTGFCSPLRPQADKTLLTNLRVSLLRLLLLITLKYRDQKITL